METTSAILRLRLRMTSLINKLPQLLKNASTSVIVAVMR